MALRVAYLDALDPPLAEPPGPAEPEDEPEEPEEPELDEDDPEAEPLPAAEPPLAPELPADPPAPLRFIVLSGVCVELCVVSVRGAAFFL